MPNKEIKISLSEEEIKKLEKKVKESEFESIQDYVSYIIKQVTSDSQLEGEFDEDEAKRQEQRLKDLGYV